MFAMDSVSNFLSVADKFLESDASIIQLSNSFIELVDDTKRRCAVLVNGNKAADIKIVTECIIKYLNCIIQYAEGGTAQTRSATLQQLCDKICTAVAKLEIKHEFVKNVSLPTFEFLFGQPSWIAKEILRMYSTAIQSSDRAVRSEVIQKKGPYYLGRLIDALPFGDFEFQLIIVETLFRICTKEELTNMPKLNFLSKEQTEAFYKISTVEFDLTARNFLNLLNEAEKHVFSLLCNKVTFDDYQLQEPPELKSFKGMWVDFNVRANTVTLFLNNEPFNEEIRWEMITLFPENILKTEISYVFNEERGKKEGVAKLILKGHCQLCNSTAQHKLFDCRLLAIHSLDTEKFREIFNQEFPKIHKMKPKQTGVFQCKRVYKPLDIVSIKSSTTNHSTTFNVTMDSSVTDKENKSNAGRKLVNVADSTKISNSSKSKTISSRKSMNNTSSNHSIQGEINLNWEDLSEMSSLKISGGNKMKRSVTFDEASLCSNLSILEQIKTRKNDGRVSTKKIRLSGLVHGNTGDTSYDAYSDKFLSKLMDIEEIADPICEYKENINMNLERNKSYSETQSKLTKKEADSTTLVSGLSNCSLLMQDEELIASDVLSSIEDLQREHKRKNLDNSDVKKARKYSHKKLCYKTLKSQDAIATQVISSSFERSSSGLSADEKLVKKKKEKQDMVQRNSKEKREDEILKKAEIHEKTKKASSLGIKLSPDLFCVPSQELFNESNEDPNKENACPIQSINNKKHVPLNKFKLRIPDVLLNDPVRDCASDEFDILKLGRPKNSPENSIIDDFHEPTEPDLIQVPKEKIPEILNTETETFETARTNLVSEEVADVQATGSQFELFQDISQVNEYFKNSSEEYSQEQNLYLNKDYKTKIKILSNIQIHSPIFKSQFSKTPLQESQEKKKLTPEMKKSTEEVAASTSPQYYDSLVCIKSSKLKSKEKNSIENMQELEKNYMLISSQENLIVNEADILIKPQNVDATDPEIADGFILQEDDVCKLSSQDLQYSETQKSDSQSSLQFDVKISQKILDDHSESKNNCGEILEDHSIQNDNKNEDQYSKPSNDEIKIIAKNIDNLGEPMDYERVSSRIEESDTIFQALKISKEVDLSHTNEKLIRNNTGKKYKKQIIKKYQRSNSLSNLNESREQKLHTADESSQSSKSNEKNSENADAGILILEKKSKKRLSLNSNYGNASQVKKPKMQVNNHMPAKKHTKLKVEQKFLMNTIGKFESSMQTSERQIQKNEDDIPLIALQEILKNTMATEIKMQKVENKLPIFKARETEMKNSTVEFLKLDESKTEMNKSQNSRGIKHKEENIENVESSKPTSERKIEINEDDIPLIELRNILKNNMTTEIKKQEVGNELPILHPLKNKIKNNVVESLELNENKNEVNESQNSRGIKHEEVNVKYIDGNVVNICRQGVTKLEKNICDIKNLSNKNYEKQEKMKIHKERQHKNSSIESQELPTNEIGTENKELKTNKHIKYKVPISPALQINVKEISAKVLNPHEKISQNMLNEAIGKQNSQKENKENSLQYTTWENIRGMENLDKQNYKNQKILSDNNKNEIISKKSSSIEMKTKHQASLSKNKNDLDKIEVSIEKNEKKEKTCIREQKSQIKKKHCYTRNSGNEIDLNGNEKQQSAEQLHININKNFIKLKNQESILLENGSQTGKKKSEKVVENLDDELEKSMCLIFGEEAEKLVSKKNYPSFDIPTEKEKGINNSTNSIITSSQGMLRRGRKLFDHENEEENFMNFTKIEEELRNTKEKETKRVNISKKEVKLKDTPKKEVKHKKTPKKEVKRMGPPKGEVTNKTFAEWEKNKNKSKSSDPKRYSEIPKQPRKKRLDAFYDRVIERLGKTSTSSRTSYSVIPKFDNQTKYDLDFSLFKESFHTNRKTPETKSRVFPNENANEEEIIHKSRRGPANSNNRNDIKNQTENDEKMPETKSKVIPNENANEEEIINESRSVPASSKNKNYIENQTENDDEGIRLFMRSIGTICQRIAKGNFKRPSPSVQKNLIAVADLLCEL